MRTYKHLSNEERDWIGIWKAEGASLRVIAQRLNRSPCTIGRELKRNGSNPSAVYRPHAAQEAATQRNQQSHRRQRLKQAWIRTRVQEGLRKGWSPELIAGRLGREGIRISHEAIYQWIYAEASYLTNYLVRRHGQRWAKGQRGGRLQLGIVNRRSIRERPGVINQRQELGHREADTVLSARSKAVLQIVVERRARYVKLRRLDRKGAAQMRQGLYENLHPFPAFLRRSVTYDNGRENSQHEQINADLGTESYFCEPYHSWEKGTVENTAGLTRRFFPKHTDFAKVSDEAVVRVENWLNQRPRKCLGYRTPEEVLTSEGVALAP
jgi:IS30 family transposase